jgi:hypothetical protein
MVQSIQDVLTATLSDLGIPAPGDIFQTMLLRDGYFVGYKFRYNGGHAIRLAGSDTIELYDEQGTLLKAASLGTGKGDAGTGAAA